MGPEKGFGFAPLEEVDDGVIWVLRRVVLTALLASPVEGSMAEAGRAGCKAGVYLGSTADQVVEVAPRGTGFEISGHRVRADSRDPT